VSLTAGIGRSTAYEALEILAAWNLAAPDGYGRWVIVRAPCLARLAEAWGIVDTIEARIAHHRAERIADQRALRIPDDPYANIAPTSRLARAAAIAPARPHRPARHRT